MANRFVHLRSLDPVRLERSGRCAPSIGRPAASPTLPLATALLTTTLRTAPPRVTNRSRSLPMLARLGCIIARAPTSPESHRVDQPGQKPQAAKQGIASGVPTRLGGVGHRVRLSDRRRVRRPRQRAHRSIFWQHAGRARHARASGCPSGTRAAGLHHEPAEPAEPTV